MGNFRSGNQSRDRRDFSRRSFDDRDSRRTQLYDAVCAECGKTCQVPFRPSGDRPVYCSECFEKKGGKDGNGSRDRRDFSRRSYGDRDSQRSAPNETDNRSASQLVEKIEALNAKLDKVIDLLLAAEKNQPEAVENEKKTTKKPPTKRVGKTTKVLTPVEEKDTEEKQLKEK
jgi:CxxC-x17-CxxC domain-containing protein